MKLRWYLTAMIAATAICWSVFTYVVQTVNPEITNWVGFLLFYLSLFFSIVGSASVIGFIIRFIALKNKLILSSVKDAFRQSFLFSFFIVAVLYLLSKGLFSWLNLALLIIGLSVLEFFILSYSKIEQGDETIFGQQEIDSDNKKEEHKEEDFENYI